MQVYIEYAFAYLNSEDVFVDGDGLRVCGGPVLRPVGELVAHELAVECA